ncbi:MAG: hypothetical protein ABSE54_05585, partial [Smithella sp.]
MTEKIKNPSIKFLSCLLLVILIIAGGALRAAAGSNSALIPPDNIHYPPLRFNLPPAQRVVLENGIILYILEDHELPLVNVSALIKTGTMYDPKGQE